MWNMYKAIASYFLHCPGEETEACLPYQDNSIFSIILLHILLGSCTCENQIQVSKLLYIKGFKRKSSADIYRAGSLKMVFLTYTGRSCSNYEPSTVNA